MARYIEGVGYAELLPPPALRPLVACYWAISGPHAAHRVLPDGCIDILVADGNSGRVVGTMRHAIVAPAGKRAILGIRFEPGEAARLLPAAPRELTDAEGSLASFWSDDGRNLQGSTNELLDAAHDERLEAEEILARAASTLDDALRARLASHGGAVDLRVRAAAEMLANGTPVATVAARVELSERQLARRFTERVGVAPKLFARVMRLQRATGMLYAGASPSLAAEACGYADQAHFTRDATDLAGVSPAAMAREMSDSSKTIDAAAE